MPSLRVDTTSTWSITSSRIAQAAAAMTVDPEAMQEGAAYYLVKGHINPGDLECSIRYTLHARPNGGPTGPPG
jgi:hypothetical protein